jgi:acyl-coenzyme A synthetase/AMP-(fatty) acid ligase
MRDISTLLKATNDNKTAILYGDRRLSYDELKEKINATYSTLRKIVKNEYRVVLKLPNTPEFIINSYAIEKIGAIPVPVSHLLKERETEEIVDDVNANVVITDGGLEVIEEDREMDLDEDVAMIFYTSGVTGRPKGIAHTKDTILTTCQTEGDLLGINEDDVISGTAPLSFTYGFGALAVIPFLFDATVSLLEHVPSQKKMPEILETIERDKVTVFYSTPTTYRLMLKQPQRYDLSSLRLLITAGEAMGIGLYRRLRLFLPYAEVVEHFGCTESFHGIISNMPGNVKPGSLGQELPCYQVRVLCEDGEECPRGVFGKLAFRGPAGRYLKDDKNKEWHNTGDIVYRDSEGYVWYVSRSDEMIKTSGYFVSPHEIENVLMENKAVSEVAVVGVPDAMLGQRLKAFVVIEESYNPSEKIKDALRRFLISQIADYKVPSDIVFVNSIPKSNRGKILRKKILSGVRQNMR